MKNLTNILTNGAQNCCKKEVWEQVKKLVEYLFLNWYDSAAEDFILKLNHTVELLAENPNIGSKVKGLNNNATILITRHNRLYYRTEKDELIVINLIDTRRNPKKNPSNKRK